MFGTMIEKSREEIIEEYELCVREALRLRAHLKDIILCIDWMGGKMRDRLDNAADIAQDALYDPDRWKRLDEIEDSLYEAAFLTEKVDRTDIHPKRKDEP
jgi:hypothetical protein